MTPPIVRPGKAGRLANLSALCNWAESETSRTLARPVISAERSRRYLIPRTVTNRVHGPERPPVDTGPARLREDAHDPAQDMGDRHLLPGRRRSRPGPDRFGREGHARPARLHRPRGRPDP